MNKEEKTLAAEKALVALLMDRDKWLSHVEEVYPDGKKIVKITARPLNGEEL